MPTYTIIQPGPQQPARPRYEIVQAAPVATGEVHRGNILPVDRDAQGNLSLNWQSGLPGIIIRGATAVEDAYQGRIPRWGSDGRTSEAMIGRAMDATALATPVNPAVRSGSGAIPGVTQNLRRQPLEPPSSQELLKVGGEQKQALGSLGVDYQLSAVARLASETRLNLEGRGLTARSTPKTFRTLRLLEAAEQPVAGYSGPKYANIKGVVSAIEELGSIAADNVGTREAVAAGVLKRRLEKFVEDAAPETVVAGPASAAGKIMREGNANYAAGKRSQKLQGIEEGAELRAATRNSGFNIDNTIRQRLEAILDPNHPERRTGFNKAELKIIRQVAEGKMKTNALRFVGNYLGGGGGLGTLTSTIGGGLAGAYAGAQYGMPLGAMGAVIPPAVGLLSRTRANAATMKALRGADEVVRSRSPLHERMLQQTPYESAYGLREALAQKALIQGILMQGDEVY